MSELKVIVANVGGRKMVCTDKGNGTGTTVCSLDIVPGMQDQITQLEKDNTELVKALRLATDTLSTFTDDSIDISSRVSSESIKTLVCIDDIMDSMK